MLEGEGGVAHTLSSPIAKIKHGKWKHVFISQNKTCLSKKRKHLKNLKCEFSKNPAQDNWKARSFWCCLHSSSWCWKGRGGFNKPVVNHPYPP